MWRHYSKKRIELKSSSHNSFNYLQRKMEKKSASLSSKLMCFNEHLKIFRSREKEILEEHEESYSAGNQFVFTNNFLKTIQKYSINATFHGLSYVFSSPNMIWQTLWFLIISFCLVTSGIFSVQSFNQWQGKMVWTSIEGLDFSINKIDFPVFTICPQGVSMNAIDSTMKSLVCTTQKI